MPSLGTSAGVLAAFAGGCGLATQASMNGALAVPLHSPLAATAVSMAVGVVCLTITSFFSLGLVKHKPSGKPVLWWFWVAPGMIGVFFVSMGTLIGPKLGFSLYFVCIVVGQLITAIGVDHIGVLDIPKSGVTGTKIAGVLIVITGAVMAVLERLSLSSSSPGTVTGLVLVSVAAGGSASVQIPITSAFTARYGTYAHRSTLLSFAVGCVITVAIYGISVGVVDDLPKPEFKAAEWWMYVGGALGAAYVFISVHLGPRIGVALFFVSVVAGQLTMSLLIDSLGLLNSEQVPVTPLRVAGVVVVFLGAVAFRFLPPLGCGGGSDPATAQGEPAPASGEHGTGDLDLSGKGDVEEATLAAAAAAARVDSWVDEGESAGDRSGSEDDAEDLEDARVAGE